MNIKQLPEGTAILSYDNLSSEAQAKARMEILISDIERQSTDIDKFRELIKIAIHECVNDNTIIPNLIRIQKHINRVNNDLKYCEAYITENVCQFTSNGNYITYMT